MLNLEDDHHCFACGTRNPIGLRLSFQWDGSLLTAAFTPLKAHQGYRDVVHGGIITTVLDECMAQAAIRKFGVMAATVDLSVRFRLPLAVGQETIAEAEAEEARHGLIEGKARLARTSDGVVVAEASSRMMRA